MNPLNQRGLHRKQRQPKNRLGKTHPRIAAQVPRRETSGRVDNRIDLQHIDPAGTRHVQGPHLAVLDPGGANFAVQANIYPRRAQFL